MKSLSVLLRFDDICPTMNHAVWRRVEEICTRYGVKPLIAVIPDNRDPQFDHPEDPAFWEHIRTLQESGWGIALHGIHHLAEATDGGLFRLNDKSEFSGLSFEQQSHSIHCGVAVFERENVKIDAWIAPYHSFDEITIELLQKQGVDVISDGFYLRPVRRNGCTWIPCTLWEGNSIPTSGFYTVCHHCDHWTEQKLASFEAFVSRYAPQIVSLADVLAQPIPDATRKDILLNRFRINLRRLKRQCKKVLKR